MSKYKPGDWVVISDLCKRLEAGLKVKIEQIYPPTALCPDGEILYGIEREDAVKPIRTSETFVWESEIAGRSSQ